MLCSADAHGWTAFTTVMEGMGERGQGIGLDFATRREAQGHQAAQVI